MRVTLVGHATWHIESAETTLLVDPVLHDPFEGGAVSSWPEREVDVAQMPAPDLIVVTHRHPDHFDIPSLARLPTSATVLLPRDPLIAYALEQLGFQRLMPLDPGKLLTWNDTQLWPTPSDEPVREVGLVVSDGSGAVFDQVDSALPHAAAAELCTRFRLAAHLCRYASQNFEFFESRHAEFPCAEHARNLETAAALAAGLVVPAAAGFRFAGPHAWLNRFLFPVSRTAFLQDLQRVAPDVRGACMDPGDVLEVEAGVAYLRRASSPFVRCSARGDALLRFDPTAAIPELVDPNPDGRATSELGAATRQLVRAMAEWACADAPPLSVPWRYRRAQAAYALEIVAPEQIECFVLDFGAPTPRLLEGDVDIEPTVVHRVAASALLDWSERRRDFFWVRAFSRRFSVTRRVAGDGAGVNVAPVLLPDLLMHWLLAESQGSEDAARRRIDLQVREARA